MQTFSWQLAKKNHNHWKQPRYTALIGEHSIIKLYYKQGSFEKKVLSTLLAFHLEKCIIGKIFTIPFLVGWYLLAIFSNLIKCSLKMSFVLDKMMQLLSQKESIYFTILIGKNI